MTNATARKLDITAWPFAGELSRLLEVLDRPIQLAHRRQRRPEVVVGESG